jgi:hypothetical protein
MGSTEHHHWHDVPRNYCALSAPKQRASFLEIKPMRKMAPRLTPKTNGTDNGTLLLLSRSSELVNQKDLPIPQKNQ